MTKASRAGATTLHGSLLEEIVLWEILVRLPPKSLLRCRAVCRAWRRATSTRPFLQAHHIRQPSVPIVCNYEYSGTRKNNILAIDHRADGARIQQVVALEEFFLPATSCDGLLILFQHGNTGISYSVCNPATRQHAPLRQLLGFTLLAMYVHRPTGEYRLLLHRTLMGHTFCYSFTLGSDQPPRYIEELAVTALAYLHKPVLVCDSLHWDPVHYGSDPLQSESKVVTVFDTTSESFRRMRAPDVPDKSYMFEMDGTLGIYNCSYAMKTVDIWVLQNYESEVWAHKYNVKLLDEEIQGRFGWVDDDWYISVESVHGDILLLVSDYGWMFYIDIDGKLVENFHRDGRDIYACELQLKQTLVPHTFFTTLEGYSVNSSPFI